MTSSTYSFYNYNSTTGDYEKLGGIVMTSRKVLPGVLEFNDTLFDPKFNKDERPEEFLAEAEAELLRDVEGLKRLKNQTNDYYKINIKAPTKEIGDKVMEKFNTFPGNNCEAYLTVVDVFTKPVQKIMRFDIGFDDTKANC